MSEPANQTLERIAEKSASAQLFVRVRENQLWHLQS